MADAVQIDLTADRWQWFDDSYSFIGQNLTGYDLFMQVRQVKDTEGTPLIDLTNVAVGGSPGLQLSYAGTATIAAHIAAARLTPDIKTIINPSTGVPFVDADSVTLSRVRILIHADSISALPFREERGSDNLFYYDLLGLPSGGVPQIMMRGAFKVRAGVTIV
jgi:hypothetical protein